MVGFNPLEELDWKGNLLRERRECGEVERALLSSPSNSVFFYLLLDFRAVKGSQALAGWLSGAHVGLLED